MADRRIPLLHTSTMERTAPAETTPLCYGCAHLQGTNDDGTARCAAFDRIPASIWSGDVDHRNVMRGDRGVTFTALGDYGRRIERAYAAGRGNVRSAAGTIRADGSVVTETEVIETPAENRPADRSSITDEQAPDAPPETFHVVAMIEDTPTGDRRMFTGGSWEELPIEFGWQKQDLPYHEGAEMVGWLTRARRDGNVLHFWGHHDAEGETGAEWYRLLTAGGRAGVSCVMDDADVEIDWPDDEDDEILFAEPELVRYTRYRIRRVDQVPTAAFTETFVEAIDPQAEAEEAAAAAVTAAAIPSRPPRSWFTDPGFTGPTALEVLDSGEIFTHLALWGTCHTSYQGACITPPHETSMDYFTTGTVVCADGSSVPVGQITLGTGHAGLDVDARAAAAHYDHTGTAVADVACGADEWGIWLHGGLRPGVTPDQIRVLRASALSGDWRQIRAARWNDDEPAGLRLVAALVVNVPGFPIPRTAARVASGGQLSLVAAGVVSCRPCAEGAPSRRRYSPGLDAAAERIAASIGRSRADRVAALTARVHG